MKELDPIIGWREWAGMPEFAIKEIKVKIDTGAKTSSLHAENLEFFRQKGKEFVRFSVYPLQRSNRIKKKATLEIIDYRRVRSSNGESENRPVVLTDLSLGPFVWPIEITLTNRDIMGFRMLIGREALKSRFIIDPAKSYLMKSKKRGIK